jgi:hypothetical protein
MNLELGGLFRYLPLIMLPVMLIFGLMGIINVFEDTDPIPQVFMIIWMGIVIYQLIRFTKMVVNIRMNDKDKVIFKTVLGKEYEIFVDDFVSIKVSNNIIDFKTSRGKFISMGNFDGFSEFVVALKKINPALITKGC